MVEQSQTSGKEEQISLEDQIRKAEENLGLKNENDKLIEASLFIDKKFLSYALITGVVQKPEHVFGEKAWADYLDGRIYTKQYRNNSLTSEFVVELQKNLTKRFAPRVSGKIRNRGVIGASYDSGQPVTYAFEQVKAIEENQYLTFKRVPAEDESSTTGFIVYPHLNAGSKTDELVKKDLEELCEWYNAEKKKDFYDPHVIAGQLQRKIISLHPFLDGNGRLSRVLMNWSLENDGVLPSMIDNPGDDILTDEETWVANIAKGSKQYEDTKNRQTMLEEAGIENVNALFDLGQDKHFYEYVFKYLKQAPPLPTNGDKHKHQVYEDFLAGFKEEMNHFQEYMRSTSKVTTSNGEREITQGGLITPEFMQFALSPAQNILPLEIRKQFYTDTEVYRGGVVDEPVDDETLCHMFQAYTAVGTGYRPLQRSYSSATSIRRIPPKIIQESMEYYNKMFALSYLQKKHPETENPYASMQPPVRDLNRTVSEHTMGGSSIWNSPFVSTSLDYKIGKSWARRFDTDYARNACHGVLFKTQLPREGMVMTFGEKFEGLTAGGFTHEYEALIAAGLQPASISEIEVYDRVRSHNNPSLVAKRTEGDGKVNVVIEDRHGKYVVKRTYVYDPAAGFGLSETVATGILSTIPIEEPAAVDPFSSGKNLLDLIGGNEKLYNSPFNFEEKLSTIGENTLKKSLNEYHIFSKIKKEENIIIPTSKSTFGQIKNINILKYDLYESGKPGYGYKKQNIISLISEPPNGNGIDDILSKYKKKPKPEKDIDWGK